MSQLDVLELKKELKTTRPKRFLQDKKNILSLSIMAANIPIIFLSDFNIIQATGAFAVGLQIEQLKRAWKQLGIPEELVIETALRDTETYKICQAEYDKYIGKIAELIRPLNFPSSKEALAYLELLLISGHFSNYHHHKYKIPAYETMELMEICGARVLTGKSVCRHQSSFCVDVLNKLGYTASNMSVISTTNDPIKLAKNRHKTWNHSVVSVAEKGQMYLFDPTCGEFSSRPTNISFDEVESILVSQFVGRDNRYLVMNPKLSAINTTHEEQFKKVITSKSMIISQGEVDYINNKAELVYKGNMHNQHQFFLEQEERRKQIEEMYKELCPHADEPIKKWLVRK